MDDEGDFKKARGFLLTYSALMLALWYFGADLTQFKLMGNEIQLHHRTHSAWLILAMVNIYFGIRFYQRLPTNSLYFDQPMRDLYNKALVWVSLRIKKRELDKSAQEHFTSNYGSSVDMEISYREGDILMPGRIDASTDKPQPYPRAERLRIRLTAGYGFNRNGAWRPASGFGAVDYEPSRPLTWAIKAFVIARGIVVTPWFTDHIAPLIIGVLSTFAALWKWYGVNFVTSQLTHGALLCT
ncbi:hypothetical protein [Pseudomonas sp. NFPP28]|uniref:hypothetical protein n=1 Tax=Pseudomonas sp. NFPP28 TaxID=1566231 RepID=UPI0008E8FC70|nr:hypothetical protein [Pseudomonas sp. NFPP28]SFP27870.1 hypothetical protein SAMN03159315_02583 [Pseudomonas sp. NFPP28]